MTDEEQIGNRLQADQVGSIGYVALVRNNHNFRYLWYGQIISLLGDWFNLIGSATLIASLTGSGMALGGLFVLRMLAPFLVSPFAGVAADRYNRKHLLIITDILRALTVLGLLFVRNESQIWLLYTLTALQMGLSGFFFPARNAILPDIVSRQELGAANALSSSTWSTMLAIGTALGGLVAGYFGIYTAFVLDALTFLASAYVLMKVRYKPTTQSQETGKGIEDVVRDYVEGLRYLVQHRDILAIVLHKSAVMFCFAGAYEVLAVPISKQIYVIGEGGGIGLGLIYATVGVGTGLGPILMRTLTGDRERALRIVIVFAYLISAAGMFIAAPLGAFSIFLIGIFWRGFGGGMVWVFATQLLMQNTPDHVRGRVFGTEFALFTLSSALGAGTIGWALDQPWLGLNQIIWWPAIATLIPVVPWGAWIIGQGGQKAIARNTVEIGD